MEKTLDGRFRSKRLQFKNLEVSELLEQVKAENNWTWKEMAVKLGVSEYTVRYDWRKQSESLPKPVVDKIREYSSLEMEVVRDIPPFRGQAKGGRKSSNGKSIRLPDEWTVDFAEFFGALLGDGCIYSNHNSICVTGNAKLDCRYIEYLAEICRDLFELEPRIYRQKNQNVIRLVLHSRELSDYLLEKGFRPGYKKEKNLSIPGPVMEERGLLVACIRGLFDTDGGVYAHPHSEIMLDITSTNETLLSSIIQAFEKLGLDAGECADRVQIYGAEKLENFMEQVGSSNPRNFLTYHYYRNQGETPSDLETLLKSRSNEFDVPYFGSVV